MDKNIFYESYLEEQGAMNFEEMNKIYHMILEQAPTNDSEFDELFVKLMNQALVYVSYRVKWMGMNRQERIEVDEERTRNHNLFIAYKNELAKYMYKNKMSIAWEDRLGEDRKRIGDFACFLVLIWGIKAR